MKIIGFNGGMGSGKTTAIDLLRQTIPNKAIVPIKFAETLYNIQDYIYSQVALVYQKPEGFVKDRKLLQWLGTEWGRGLNENLWVEIWKAKVDLASRLGPDIIIVSDDCRFDNEASAIHQLGGTVIKINRNNNLQAAHGGVGIANHASEAGIKSDLVDFIIENNSTVEDYKVSLSTLYREMGLL